MPVRLTYHGNPKGGVAPSHIRPQAGDRSALVPPHLTARQAEALTLLAEGLRQETIAEHMCCGKRTVTGFIQNAMHELHASTPTQAVAIAVRDGLIHPKDERYD